MFFLLFASQIFYRLTNTFIKAIIRLDQIRDVFFIL